MPFARYQAALATKPYHMLEEVLEHLWGKRKRAFVRTL
jgi:hypothetical protein